MPDYQVLGVVPNREVGETVVGNLRLAGFTQDAVSLVMVRPEESEQMAQLDDQTGEGAAEVVSDVAKGAGIGATVGLAAGAATLAIPGLGIVVGGGILLALFGGAGAFVGALSGAFASEDVSDQVIQRYGMALREGQAVICVTAPDVERAKAAQERLKDIGASNVNVYQEGTFPIGETEDTSGT